MKWELSWCRYARIFLWGFTGLLVLISDSVSPLHYGLCWGCLILAYILNVVDAGTIDSLRKQRNVLLSLVEDIFSTIESSKKNGNSQPKTSNASDYPEG